MIKLLAIILTLVMVITLFAGCNKSYGPGNYTFEKIHIDNHHYSGCLTVEKWYENSTGIEVLTKEAGAIYVSEGQYILIEGNKGCQFCSNNK